MKKRSAVLLFLFGLGGVVGSILDTAYRSLSEGTLASSSYIGTLLGGVFFPFLPVYGLGLVTIYVLYIHLQKTPWYLRLLLYTGSLSFLELVAGVFTVETLDVRLWDYSQGFLNMWGHTDLLHAFYWLVLGTSVHELFSRWPPEEWLAAENFRGKAKDMKDKLGLKLAGLMIRKW